MKPLIVLATVFLISLLISWLTLPVINYRLCGRIALAIMLLFTAFGHFKFTAGMAMMLPSFFPWKHSIIIITGFFEILGAIGILIPTTQRLSGILLIVFFIAILPSNIYASIRKVNIESATYDGSGMNYLWFRIPLQIFFIAWTYVMVIQ